MSLTKKLMVLMVIAQINLVYASDYLIYSIMQEVPMGDGTNPRKNYYVNIGKNQGLGNGSTLDVFRTIIRTDPYETKKRYNYKIKIGELQVIHHDDDAAIAISKMLHSGETMPITDVTNFMIGDHVSINVGN